jgi:hypothetical protein
MNATRQNFPAAFVGKDIPLETRKGIVKEERDAVIQK